jgi:hypothetical protein
METIAHQQLKRLSLRFLRATGCLAFATEVRCPISRYRVDCAGWQDRSPGVSGERRRCEPRTILVECKQSREDFLRDRQSVETLLKLRSHADRVRASIEELRIKIEEPHLRCTGTSLFAELETWDFAASRLPSYQRALKQLRRIDEQLYGETKFFMIAQYQLADRMYIAAPRGMVRPCELPRGWGLLECPPRSLARLVVGDRLDEPPALSVKVAAAELRPRPEHHVRLLRNIAVAATMAMADRQRGPSVSDFSAAAAPA